MSHPAAPLVSDAHGAQKGLLTFQPDLPRCDRHDRRLCLGSTGPPTWEMHREAVGLKKTRLLQSES